MRRNLSSEKGEAKRVSQSLESFGKYILLEKLAMGGMAEIYLAKNSGASGVSKFIAIKRILPQFTEQTEFIDMFKDEAKIAVNLSHANIVSIHEFGIEKSAFYLAMDYIEGRNLRQILNKMKKADLALSIEQVLYIIKEVAAGLDHAHRCIDAQTGKPLNIIHRDMSPQNVMISFEGEVKIVDFGIAKAETQLETTRAGTLKGKFGYMSPEQAEGLPVDLRTDVFALGIVLWELLANDRLFVANNEMNTLRKIRDCQIPSLRKINPNIPAELERIVSKALAKDRNMRYQTSAALHRDLSRFLNRQYPDFSPQDFSVFIKTLFAGEILDSRRKMVEFSKLEAPKAQVVAPAPTRTPERVEVTDTETQNTKTEMEASDPSINFGNSDHRAKPSFLNPNAPRAKVTPPPSTIAPPSQSAAQAGTLRPRTSTKASKETLTFERGTSIGSYGPREHTYAGTRTSARPIQESRSATSFVTTLILIGCLLGGGAYMYTNPKKVTAEIQRTISNIGLFKQPEERRDQASELPAVKMVDVFITSTPSGAPIELDGAPTGEVTPATLSLEKGRKVRISMRLASYLPSPFEERFQVEGPKTVDAKFKSDKKGFLNVIVRGEGIIYINNKVVASTSPARMIAVPADENITVTAYDPKTKATDQAVTTVNEGATRTITLTPRAPQSL